ncbi:MAG: indolepyruvate oxidoreductase subunit beta [Eubacteriales bacterium]|nr:indolepyruvate oxidoreductase subunit beta [Eubacteriales bacterium]
MKKDIIICGVGGQGTLLTSRILGHVAMSAGLDVKLSEVHGMSQRGGSVVTYVRMGDGIASPLIEKGGADMIIAFEELEAVRYLPYLKKNGHVVVNTNRILPMPVITGAAAYPENLMEILTAAAEVTAVDAQALAEKAGSVRSVNVALLGAAARQFSFTPQQWQEAIRSCVPAKTVEKNLLAFAYGNGEK